MLGDTVHGGALAGLGGVQARFSFLVASLIMKAYAMGYEVTLGDAFRSPAEAFRQGFSASLHTKRLAIDLNLFQAGRYLTRTEDYRALGIWWEAQAADCAWGGRFGDGNHFSITYGGVR